jgi:hypothetical protein
MCLISKMLNDNLTIKQSDQLENIQRRAALICTGAYMHTEHRVLLGELGWEPLSCRRKIHRLITYYKLYYGPTPAHIVPLMAQPVSAHTTYNLRNKHNIRVPQTRLEKSKGSFFPKTINDWNNLPIETRASLTINCFKGKIQPQLFKNPYTKTHYGRGGIWLTRIRMGLSGLNSQRFTYNFINSPMCTLCNKGAETPLHYFWVCVNHALARQQMAGDIMRETGVQADRNNIISIIVHGEADKIHHAKIYITVTAFMAETKRFK